MTKELDGRCAQVALARLRHRSLCVLLRGPPHALTALLHGTLLAGLLGATDSPGQGSLAALAGERMMMTLHHGGAPQDGEKRDVSSVLCL